MPAKHSRHIALTGPLAAWVEGQVTGNEYASTSDLVRAAIRLLKTQAELQGVHNPQRGQLPAKDGQP